MRPHLPCMRGSVRRSDCAATVCAALCVCVCVCVCGSVCVVVCACVRVRVCLASAFAMLPCLCVHMRACLRAHVHARMSLLFLCTIVGLRWEVPSVTSVHVPAFELAAEVRLAPRFLRSLWWCW